MSDLDAGIVLGSIIIGGRYAWHEYRLWREKKTGCAAYPSTELERLIIAYQLRVDNDALRLKAAYSLADSE